MPNRCATAMIWLLASLVTTAAGAGSIAGAGATFPAPLYDAWAKAARQPGGADVSYAPVGSAAGIERLRHGDVDFAGSDAPLRADELQRDALVQFPVVIGGVVPVVNIPGIASGALRLDGAILADIYLGHTRTWNAPAIAALNPTLRLPAAHITVVHRRDASGSSLLWTSYLAATSVDWRLGVGAGLSPAWPAGIGGEGNEGVASYVKRTRYAIGYVEYAYARNHRLSDAALRNRDGVFVVAGRAAFEAAASSADWNGPAYAEALPLDARGAASWPITGTSFILVPARATANDVLDFFADGLLHGVEAAHSLDYAVVPASVIARARDELHRATRAPAS